MLKDIGATHVLVGHSERRQYHAESNAGGGRQVCAGAVRRADSGAVRRRNPGAARRRNHGVDHCGSSSTRCSNDSGIGAFSTSIVAYEPVWAIGTGRTATPAQAQAVHAFIRSKFDRVDGTISSSLRILYGGSVEAANAAELFAQADVDGGLIGGASLIADDFLAICRRSATMN